MWMPIFLSDMLQQQMLFHDNVRNNQYHSHQLNSIFTLSNKLDVPMFLEYHF